MFIINDVPERGSPETTKTGDDGGFTEVIDNSPVARGAYRSRSGR
jgi:hypothetical protein